MTETGEGFFETPPYLEAAQELHEKIVTGEVRVDDLPPALQAAFEEEDTDCSGATGTASVPY